MGTAVAEEERRAVAASASAGRPTDGAAVDAIEVAVRAVVLGTGCGDACVGSSTLLALVAGVTVANVPVDLVRAASTVRAGLAYAFVNVLVAVPRVTCLGLISPSGVAFTFIFIK